MTRRSWLGELLYPLVTPAVVIPLLVSWVLFAVALAFGFFGLLLLLVTLVPFTRYLMALLRARAHNREAPVFDAELMSMAGNSYQLFPLVTIFLLLAALSWLQPQVNETVILLLIVAACYLFPASLAVLSLTRSPMQSWNPAAIFRLVRELGNDYVIAVLLLSAVGFGSYFLSGSGLPSFVTLLSEIYFAFLVYSMTGAITGDKEIAAEVDIPEPVEISHEEAGERVVKARENVATHAYGFASRGNREGALRHIQQHIAGEDYPGDAWPWFFRKMLTWDNQDHALFFAQIYLGKLLAADEDALALKLISECLHVNPQFRPAMNDRDAVSALVEKHQRSDLKEQLR